MSKRQPKPEIQRLRHRVAKWQKIAWQYRTEAEVWQKAYSEASKELAELKNEQGQHKTAP